VAEHVMLVDLARNDVGRVATWGTVEVDELMVLEGYSHVMHLTSQVSGRLRPELGPVDVLRATLPAGTMSGAPKVRAMQIIDALEPTRRGPYAGLVGYLDFSGNLDTAIAIRTMVVADGGRASVQAGAGIVADSDPEAEEQESRNKAAALLAAVPAARRMTARRREAAAPEPAVAPDRSREHRRPADGRHR
jgi:anthranilate synthase component 1